MYEIFYNLKTEPFRLTPDQKFCFSHKSYAKAKAYMQYAFERAEGFVMITGKAGTGKTTLVNDLVHTLPKHKVDVATLVSTQLEANDLLRTAAYAFGLDAGVTHKATVLQDMAKQLIANYKSGRRALLIIDEAQDLGASALEELRLLTNFQLNSQPLIQIFLVGQEKLSQLVQSPAMEQVHQRLVAACHLEALSEADTKTYIKHRLTRAGWRGDPAISNAVFSIVFQFSNGIPRRINLICSRLLLHGSVEERHQLGVDDARIVLKELENEQLASGDLFAQIDFDTPDHYDADDLSVLDAKPDTGEGLSIVAESDEPPTGEVSTAQPATAEQHRPNFRQDESVRDAWIQSTPNATTENSTDESLSRTVENNSPEAALNRDAAPGEQSASTTTRQEYRDALLQTSANTNVYKYLSIALFVLVLTILSYAWTTRDNTQARQFKSGDALNAVKTVSAAGKSPVKIRPSGSAAEPIGSTASSPMPAPTRPSIPGTDTGKGTETEAEAETETETEKVILGKTLAVAPTLPGDWSTRLADQENAENAQALAADNDSDRRPPEAQPANTTPATNAPELTIAFQFDSFYIDPVNQTKLDNLVESADRFERKKAIIVGYSDSIGDAAYNLQLSKQRAIAVAAYLARRGVSMEHMETLGKGYPAKNTIGNGSDTDAVHGEQRIVKIFIASPDDDSRTVTR